MSSDYLECDECKELFHNDELKTVILEGGLPMTYCKNCEPEDGEYKNPLRDI